MSKSHLIWISNNSIKADLSQEECKQDIIFIDKLDNNDHFAIKDIQSFIRRRLTGYKNCHFMYNSHISSIDMQKGILSIESEMQEEQNLKQVKEFSFI